MAQKANSLEDELRSLRAAQEKVAKLVVDVRLDGGGSPTTFQTILVLVNGIVSNVKAITPHIRGPTTVEALMDYTKRMVLTPPIRKLCLFIHLL
jgi:C-terminal processing protease CtpA/Prc